MIKGAKFTLERKNPEDYKNYETRAKIYTE